MARSTKVALSIPLMIPKDVQPSLVKGLLVARSSLWLTKRRLVFSAQALRSTLLFGALMVRDMFLKMSVMMSFPALMNSHPPVVGLFQAFLTFNPLSKPAIPIPVLLIHPLLRPAMDFLMGNVIQRISLSFTIK